MRSAFVRFAYKYILAPLFSLPHWTCCLFRLSSDAPTIADACLKTANETVPFDYDWMLRARPTTVRYVVVPILLQWIDVLKETPDPQENVVTHVAAIIDRLPSSVASHETRLFMRSTLPTSPPPTVDILRERSIGANAPGLSGGGAANRQVPVWNKKHALPSRHSFEGNHEVGRLRWEAREKEGPRRRSSTTAVWLDVADVKNGRPTRRLAFLTTAQRLRIVGEHDHVDGTQPIIA